MQIQLTNTAPAAAGLARPANDGFETATAMFVVDETLRVISADDMGRDVLGREAGVRLSLGRLCTGNMSINARIREGVTQGQAASDLRVANEGQSFTMSVVPLAAFGGDIAARRQALVTLRVESASVDNIARVKLGCGLTAAETEVLRLIYKGLNTVEVAGVMGIAKSTVRTHLHHVFDKTDTSRQSELVHFVVTYEA